MLVFGNTGNVLMPPAAPPNVASKSTRIYLTRLSLFMTDCHPISPGSVPQLFHSISIQTVNTIYRDNTGDGAFPESDSASQAGLKVRNDGCFDSSSTSPETVADDYIKDNVC